PLHPRCDTPEFDPFRGSRCGKSRPPAGTTRIAGMKREVYITGVGPVCGLGLGIDEVWSRLIDGQTGIAPIQAFDPSGFGSTLAAEVRDFSIKDFVPKTYRKATKVMARDIELAVAAAELAAKDAGLATKCTAPDDPPDYDPARFGCHIGAGLIAADVDEL